MKHMFDLRSERCLACGQSRMDAKPNCKGHVRFREILRLSGATIVWVRQPVYAPMSAA